MGRKIKCSDEKTLRRLLELLEIDNKEGTVHSQDYLLNGKNGRPRYDPKLVRDYISGLEGPGASMLRVFDRININKDVEFDFSSGFEGGSAIINGEEVGIDLSPLRDQEDSFIPREYGFYVERHTYGLYFYKEKPHVEVGIENFDLRSVDDLKREARILAGISELFESIIQDYETHRNSNKT